jgi:hypothetical protein
MRNARGKKAIPTTGVNIAIPIESMQNAAEIDNGASQLTTLTV